MNLPDSANPFNFNLWTCETPLKEVIDKNPEGL